MASIPSPDQLLQIGQVQAAHGLKGWVKVFSNTDPTSNLFAYTPWYLCQGGQWREAKVAEWREQGKGLVMRLADSHDRDDAEALRGAVIWAPRHSLPELADGDYYWSDLIELQVWTVNGVLLGQVHSLMETGSNDVLVVRACPGSLDARERLIPWLPDQVVTSVDRAAKRLSVDWDPDF